MSEAIYDWMKNLAVFYILLTAVMNLVPNEKYGEYIRYFMGLVLILLVTAPLLRLAGIQDSLEAYLARKLMEEEQMESQWYRMEEGLWGGESEDYLLQGYEREVEGHIADVASGKGLDVAQVEAALVLKPQWQVTAITIYIRQACSGAVKGEVADELGEIYETPGENIRILMEEPG